MFSLLTKSTTPLLGSISSVFGVIMNAIYNFFNSAFGIESLGTTIIIFTLLVRVLMLPLAIKQQKSTQEMQFIQPQLKKIQAKYKEKKDAENQKKYQAEMAALYKEHNVNPFGGCLPLVIQLPIIFSLFAVLRNIPAYIDKVKNIYLGIYNTITGLTGVNDALLALNKTDLAAEKTAALVPKFDPASTDSIVDLLAKFSPSHWDSFTNTFASVSTNLEPLIEKVHAMNYFFTIDLATRPISGLSDIFTVGALIPLLCLIAQIFVTRTMTAKAKASSTGDNAAADQTQKTMTYMMPLITVFFVSTMPAGLGLYWLTSNVFQLVQQIVINKYVVNKKKE
ncbi:MAG: YidC/Oxa1 family membrane protein insertase [Vallitaleaceae bacterium]|jgi:YidC/Oxa1 family membrane protein insertase|nr:YidC/Oxa1 family membrane protein insertase [Vallitaleaceae bacterium]